MIHLKNSFLALLIILIFSRCSEVYNPKIDSNADALIVEGLITDGEGPFSIKLTKAVLFSSDSTSEINYVTGAKLTVNDNENNSVDLIDAGLGTYTLPTGFKAKIGNSYKLHILTTDGNIFESNDQKLLSPQSYDSIHASYGTQGYLDKNNVYKKVGGAIIEEDLFQNISNLDSVPVCRFNSVITLQYIFPLYTPSITDWHWIYFGWESFQLNSIENITDEKSLSSNSILKNHSLGFMPFDALSYGYVMPLNSDVYYYLRINQYTMNHDSYLFYKGANKQLAATGKIFDPVTAQLYGNLKCVNNPTKTVLGLFEVSSVTQQAFVVTLVVSDKSVKITKVPYIFVPGTTEKEYKVWDGNPLLKPKDPSYDYIPMPDWWYHNL